MARPAEVEVTVVRVFCGEGGTWGNPLGVVLDGSAVAADDRQALAAHLGYSETVFVDDPAQGRIQIFTPTVEMPFAGHPTFGTAWLLRREGLSVDALRPPAGEGARPLRRRVPFIAAGPEWAPPFELRRLADAAAVGRSRSSRGSRLSLAWIDEPPGWFGRAHSSPEAGIAEDEATGAAAVRLCAELGRRSRSHRAAAR